MSKDVLTGFKPYQEGNAGCYKRLGKSSIGAKVFKDTSKSDVDIEFIHNVYAATSGLTSVAIACGTIKSTIDGKTKSRPVIYMKHIDGCSVTEYATMLGLQHNDKFTKAEAYKWGYESAPRMKPILNQMASVLDTLAEMGFDNNDLADNSDNFRIDNQGIVLAIDFGANRISDKAILREMFAKFAHLTEFSRIPEELMSKLDQELLSA